MMEKMYVVQTEWGNFWCGMGKFDPQLRKAQIFHSLKYAEDVVRRYKERNPKILEVSLAIVPEAKTNADRIRDEMSTDEGLAEFLCVYLDDWGEYDSPVGVFETREEAITKTVEWLQQEAEFAEGRVNDA